MRKIFVCYILLHFSLLVFAQTQLNEGIQWQSGQTWEQIIEKARQANKYIFVDCYATWCKPCKLMDKEVYPDSNVGAVMRENYIGVRIQMDITPEDNAEIKMWYEVAKMMTKKYRIEAFPTFLFFTPDGKLIYKEVGARNAQQFIRMVNAARDPGRLLNFRRYEEYKVGKKDIETMGELALFTKNYVLDIAVANKMAREYINYLNNKEKIYFLTKKNSDFISEFWDIVKSGDKYFKIAYSEPEIINSPRNTPDFASGIVDQVITKEEIESRIKKYDLSFSPNWDMMVSIIAQKYKKVDAYKLVLEYKIIYYDKQKNWRLWARYKDDMIKRYPPLPPYGLVVYSDINGHGGAWHAFLKCNDSLVLENALEWVNLALDLEGEKNKDAYLDTKAQLLYKLGRVREAIALEKQSLEFTIKNKGSEDYIESVKNVIKQMENGEPTYLDEHAIWNVSKVIEK